MNDEVAHEIERIKEIGMVYSFDGLAVSDFLTQLDKLVDVEYVKFEGSRLTVFTGAVKTCSPSDVTAIIPSAAMLNVANAFVEQTNEGSNLIFEWILPGGFHLSG
jgi:hypothetical protein